MKVLVILGHPNKESFNHAIAEQCVRSLQNNKHDVIFHDLYAEKFNPILQHNEISKCAVLDPNLENYCSELAAADALVIVHPVWWEMPPAVLKGWVDRVFRPGIAYEFHEVEDGVGKSVCLLKIRKVAILNTSNTPKHLQIKEDPLTIVWRDSIFGIIDPPVEFFRKQFGMIVTSNLEQRKQWLKETVEIIDRLFPKNGD